jgi:hypothetical protein
MSNQPPTTPFTQSNGTHRPFRVADQSGRYARADTPEGVSDELAALFLGGVDEGARSPDEAPATQAELKPVGGSHRPTLSLLVLGNLPVFAAAWAGQYARDRQRDSGRPLALLSLGEEAARLEVLGHAGAQASRGADLGRALADVGRMGADLVVRLPEAEAGWIGGECGAASMTILTGADDPAIVGAYQSFKAIAQDLPSDAAGPAMRVAVAGCDEPIAADAGAKLADATERFLGFSVGREPPVRRIDAGASVEVYHGEPVAWADVPDLLARYSNRTEATGPIEVWSSAGEGFEPRRVAPPAGFDAEGAALHAGKPLNPTGGKPGPAPQAKADPNPLPEGLELVDVACPYARGVRVAVDGEGTLHAVAWAADSEAASLAVRDLVVASSWLRDHAELVAVIMGRPFSGLPSVRHLVLREGRGALGLAQGDLRVHVVAPGASVLVDLN